MRADNRLNLLSRELLDHVPEREDNTIHEFSFLVERETRRLAAPGRRLPSDPRWRGVGVLGEIWVIVVHSNHDPGVNRQCTPWADILDVRTSYSCRGERFVDCREDSTWDCWFGFSRPVPVLVVHAGAVSVLDMCES